MAEIEDKVILELLREGKILEENIINDVYRMYLQLKKAGDTAKLLEVFVNRGYLSNEQVQQLFNQNNTKSPQKISDYNIIKKLGAGGMGSVFLVKKDDSSTLLALKVLPKSSSLNDKIISRFNREFRALQQLKHPSIIGGIEKGFSNGYHFYVMQFFEGQNLKSYLDKNKPIDFKKAVEIIRDIALGLQYAIGLGIIHRDIKPDNIIITNDGGVKIIDFGLVKIENEDSLGLTRTQTAMGTPYFISCEQAKNAKKADLRSDIYSLGATLFYMVTLEYPVKGTTAYEVLAALISGQVEKPKNVNALIPESLNQLILNMMGLAVEDRYQNYESLLADIELFLKGYKIKPLIKDQNKAAKYIIAKKNILMLSVLVVLLGIIFYLYNRIPATRELPKDTTVSVNNLTPIEKEEYKVQAVENREEARKYRIINSFDREYKRKTSLNEFPLIDSKLDKLLIWLSNQDIDDKASKDEKLLTRAFVLLAFCGAGYDFYQGQDLKIMEEYLHYIVDAQTDVGKWSSDIWVNTLCTITIIESFAMYGSDNEQLSLLSIEALNQLENQIKDFNLKSTDKSILGSHLYITAFRLARIAGLPKGTKFKPGVFQRLLRFLRQMDEMKKDAKADFLDKLDFEALVQLFGRSEVINDFMIQLEVKRYVPASCREAYFFLLYYGLSGNKTESKWMLDNAMSYLDSKKIFGNEIKTLSPVNGAIITNAIAALAIENIYKIPREVIPKR